MSFEDIRLSDVIRTKNRIDRFLTVFFMPALVSQVLYFASYFSHYDPWEGIFYVPTHQLFIAIIVAFLSFHSFARIAATHNKELRKEYYEYVLPKKKFFDKVKFFWSVKRLKFGALLFSLVYIIFPTRILYTCFWFCFLKSSDAFLPNLIFKIVSLSVFLVLLVLAHVTASKDWDIEIVEEQILEKQQLEKRKRKMFAFEKEIAFTVFIYLVGSIGMWYLWPTLQSFTAIFVMLYEEARIPLFIILAILIITPFAYRTTRALLIRKKLLKGLKKLADEKKCEITEIKYPYKSIFSVYKGESFRLTVDGVTYSCKLFGAPKKYTPFILFPGGIGVWHISVKVLRVELFSYRKGFNFGYDSEFQKILIVNPIPKFYFTVFGYKTVAIDNGDNVDGYKVYSATAFLNSIDRKCLDK